MNKKVKLFELADKKFINVAKGKNLPKNYRDKGDFPVIAAGKSIAYFSSHANYNTNTITISSSGANAGFVWKHTYPIWASDCTVIEVNENINLDYFYLFLLSKQEIIYSFQTGAGQPHVYWKDIKNIEIDLPSLEKQRKIAKTLDKANELIELRKESITKLDALAKSIFIDMFGDPLSKDIKNFELLGSVANIVMGQSPNGDSYNDKGLGEPLLNGPTEFGKKYPKEKQYTTNPKKFSKYGDILFCVRGATAGKLNYSDKKYCIGRGLASISSKSKYSNSYLFYLLEYHYDYFQKTSNGSTFINICKDDLFNLKVPISNENLQNKFAKIIEKIEEQKSLYEKELEKLEENFQALLQKSFQE